MPAAEVYQLPLWERDRKRPPGEHQPRQDSLTFLAFTHGPRWAIGLLSPDFCEPTVPYILLRNPLRLQVYCVFRHLRSFSLGFPLLPAYSDHFIACITMALSLRTLFYCSELVCWECHACIACENDPIMRRSTTEGSWQFKEHQMKNKSKTYYRRFSKATSVTGTLLGPLCCHDISKKVTFDKDRWRAFSGLANMVQRVSRLTLIAGLWREEFLLELAWESRNLGGG